MKTCFYTPYASCRSWREMIDLSVEHEFDCLEFFTNMELAEPDPEAARRLRAYADEKGIKACCLSSFVNLTGDDSALQISREKGFAEVAAILGAPFLHHTICCDFQHPEQALSRKEEFFEKGVAAVREIYDHAQKSGIRTIYEDQAFLFNGIAGFDRFLKVVDRPVGVVADFGNIRQMDEEILAFIKAYAPRIVHVHLKDSVLHSADATPPRGAYPTVSGKWIEEVILGTGTVPNREGIALLKEWGYDGICSIEWNSVDGALRSSVVERVRSWME